MSDKEHWHGAGRGCCPHPDCVAATQVHTPPEKVHVRCTVCGGLYELGVPDAHICPGEIKSLEDAKDVIPRQIPCYLCKQHHESGTPCDIVAKDAISGHCGVCDQDYVGPLSDHFRNDHPDYTPIARATPTPGSEVVVSQCGSGAIGLRLPCRLCGGRHSKGTACFPVVDDPQRLASKNDLFRLAYRPGRTTREDVVREFHAKFGFAIGQSILGIRDMEVETTLRTIGQMVKAASSTIQERATELQQQGDSRLYRMHLILEEAAELCLAIADRDIIRIADGMADLQYVLSGTAVALEDLPLEALFQEVHRSNMTKSRDPNDLRMRRKDPALGYSKPDIKGVLDANR